MLQLKQNPTNIEMWDRFLKLGLPGKESDLYRYVRLKDLYSQEYQLPGAFEGQILESNDTLVFVNGTFCPHLSTVPKPWIALPLSVARKTYGQFLNPRLQLKEEQDPFAILNGACFSEGLLLYLPPKSHAEKPLKIVHLTHSLEEPALMCPRIHIFAGKDSQGSLHFSQKLTVAHAWANSFIDIALDERANLSFTHLNEQHESAHDFLAVRATLKNRSHFKSFSCTNGGATSRHDYQVRLTESDAEAYLYGVWDLKGARQHHVNVLMQHVEPNCVSLQKFKGVVRESSRSSFEGKIYVNKEAQKTQAYQMNHNLVLDERASAYVKPNLEIFADDVKASHGATVGQLDAEHLFYLRSRGMTQEEAYALLVRGFTREIVESLETPELKQEALAILS